MKLTDSQSGDLSCLSWVYGDCSPLACDAMYIFWQIVTSISEDCLSVLR